MFFALLVGCSEYELKGENFAATGSDLDDTGGVDVETVFDSPPVDDSGGGTVGDTGCDTADPVVTAWNVGAPEPDPSATVPACTDVGPVDWNVVEEWSYTWGPDHFLMNPVVAPNRGAPHASVFLDLPVVGSTTSNLVELDGRDGSVIGSIGYDTHDDDGSTPFVGDADGDGFAEVVITNWYDGLFLVDTATGTVTSWPGTYGDDEVATRVDVDLDGAFEVLTPSAAYDADGTRRVTYTDVTESTGAFASDLDGDGRPEWVNGAGVWSAADGTGAAWDPAATPDYSLYGAPVDVGGVGGVLFTTGRDRVQLGLVDGTLPWQSNVAGERGMAALADATGDGVPEMCAVGEGRLYLLGPDGGVQQVWDFGGRWLVAGGCSMADLDADGVYEVLLSAYDAFRILDGRTGDVLVELPEYGTWPRDAPPVVADLDADGSAEVLVSAGWDLVALGPATGRWARTRPVWNQLAYDLTSIRDDGTLVSAPAPAWTLDLFRAQPGRDGLVPDLALDVAATHECGATTLAIDLRNQGSVEAAAGALLRVYGVVGGVLVEATSVAVADAIGPGEHVLADVVLDDALVGGGWVVEVIPAHDDECDRVNDRVEGWPAPASPM